MHEHNAGGTLQVDHFDPSLKHYENLILSHFHTNGRKSDIQPTKADERKGFRFLNPFFEHDYGIHLFEILATGRLVSPTPAGVYQIENCDLNWSHYCRARLNRTEMIAELDQLERQSIAFRDVTEGIGTIRRLRQLIEMAVPIVPPPPDDGRAYFDNLLDFVEGQRQGR